MCGACLISHMIGYIFHMRYRTISIILAVSFVKGIAASALVAVLFEKTEKTRQQLFVCWKFTACCL